jgi:hypothetical protein
MNSIVSKFVAALFVCLFCISCLKDRMTTSVLTESQAIALAKKEFGKTGRRVEDYHITVDSSTKGEEWIVWFELNVRYPPPGSTHGVRVGKKTGRAVFVLGK